MMSKKVLDVFLVLVLGIVFLKISLQSAFAQTTLTSCKQSEVGQTKCVNGFVATCTQTTVRSEEGTERVYLWRTSSTPCITPTPTSAPTSVPTATGVITLTPTPIPTSTPTPTLTPTVVPTALPTITQIPNCPLKMLGDANCDGLINTLDYENWVCEFLGNGQCRQNVITRAADFNLAGGVTLNDFEIYRQNFYTPPPTLTPSITPTRTPVSPKATPNSEPAITSSPTPTQSPINNNPAELIRIQSPANEANKSIEQLCQNQEIPSHCTPACKVFETEGQAYYLQAANTLSGDSCSDVVPENTTYLQICCQKN